MTRTFHAVTASEFEDVVEAFPFTRTITEVHLHHTWRPRQVDYRGVATIEGMWRHHTEVNGWSDIAQHVSVGPDGSIWLCRNFNWSPASAKGFNGNQVAGPFMIEMIGDFDDGKETPTDEQHTATLTVIKAIQERFDLKPAALRFHNEMSGKTCPGHTWSKQKTIKDIGAFDLASLRQGSARGQADAPFGARAKRAWQAMRSMQPEAPQPDNMDAAEHGVGLESLEPSSRGGFGSGGLTEEMIEALTDHVVNLERGQFSESGRIETTKEDVDRIFEEILPAEIKTAKKRKRTPRILFYAHGGLVSEKNALVGAFSQLKFWRENHVYPIFFIWETGLIETIKQLITSSDSRSRASRGFSSFTDNIIEELVRALGGVTVWGGMQSSAALASAASGGARYVAKRVAKLLDEVSGDVEIHCVGHSAGAIFHAHFMDALSDNKVAVKTAHFLAPAIRNDLFHEEVAPLLGKSVGPLTIFTMTKRREKKDTVTPAYRKSLLYLIYEALERKRQTDILGLEISLRGDKQTRKIFGLGAKPSKKGDVVFSPSRDAASGSASDSRTHGGFDNDKLTMESVARRILDLRDGQPIAPFDPPASRGPDDFSDDQLDLPEDLAELLSTGLLAPSTPSIGSGTGLCTGPKPSPIRPSTDQAAAHVDSSVTRRIALCIGIDNYDRQPLAGCVNDARLWAHTLQELGYAPTLLLDRDATGEAIRSEVQALIDQARPGDDIVLQFAGHGTRMDDRDGDEQGGDTPAYDECFCAVDCDRREDGLVIDDEFRNMFAGLAAGASLTCFFDCCHSGSITRAHKLAIGARTSVDRRARMLMPSSTMKHAYRKLRSRVGMFRGSQRDVLFSACRSDQLAYENNGQGDFTRHATGLIGRGTFDLSNRDFLERLIDAFGDTRLQEPQLHCDASNRRSDFLALSRP